MTLDIKPADLPADYYSFTNYVSRHRILTYWYQIKEVLGLKPADVIEVGVGTGMVTSYLRYRGLNVKTVDINSELKPDQVGSVLELTQTTGENACDLLLCARVLHHLPYATLGQSLGEIARATRKYAVITLPVEDLSFYFMFRYTSSNIRTLRIPVPLLFIKRLFWKRTRSGQWKINDSGEHKADKVRAIFERHFKVLKSYRIPEDSAHMVYVLEKR